jgi:hypothetical protein
MLSFDIMQLEMRIYVGMSYFILSLHDFLVYFCNVLFSVVNLQAEITFLISVSFYLKILTLL